MLRRKGFTFHIIHLYKQILISFAKSNQIKIRIFSQIPLHNCFQNGSDFECVSTVITCKTKKGKGGFDYLSKYLFVLNICCTPISTSIIFIFQDFSKASKWIHQIILLSCEFEASKPWSFNVFNLLILDEMYSNISIINQ